MGALGGMSGMAVGEPVCSGMPGAGMLSYTRRLFRNSGAPFAAWPGLMPVGRGATVLRPSCPRVLPTMEINPILNSIKDLSERTQTIRGYL